VKRKRKKIFAKTLCIKIAILVFLPVGTNKKNFHVVKIAFSSLLCALYENKHRGTLIPLTWAAEKKGLFTILANRANENDVNFKKFPKCASARE
jgi:hypothetical protein